MTGESDVLDLQHDQHQRPGPTWGTKYTTQCYELLKTCGTGEMDDFAVLAQGVVRCLGGMLEVLVSAILPEGGKQDKDEDKKDISYYEASPSSLFDTLSFPCHTANLNHIRSQPSQTYTISSHPLRIYSHRS